MDPEFKRFNGYSFYIPIAIFSRVVDGEFFKDCFGRNNSFRFESYLKKDYRFKNSVYNRFMIYDGGEVKSMFGLSKPGGDKLAFYEIAYKCNDNSYITIADRKRKALAVPDYASLLKIYQLVECLT